ncbi:response regulator [Mangrovicella endophytica]|uniref:response regulator n=1 Tax=Mangrovicella endophytica TaxID=2066697 RepID=UPI000C9DA986|nr:response regulator transcription factor [Mangrovicella endophytica]
MSRTFIVADDHPLFRGALKEILASLADSVTVEASDFDDAAAALTAHPDADLMLLDLAMPGNGGLSGLAVLRAEHPGVPIAIVSGSDDAVVIARALELGASGFIPKSASLDVIRDGIGRLLAGDVFLPEGFTPPSEPDPELSSIADRLRRLTPQQTRVLAMLARGLLNKQIAYELDVSEATVKAHVSAILQKLGVDSRTQAVILLGKLGWSQ